jgi:hypothetical protein
MTADYRGRPQPTLLQNITPTTASTNATKSYAVAAQTTPTKDQAIVTITNEGITIKDSIMAVAESSDRSNVRFTRYIKRLSLHTPYRFRKR